MAVTKIPAIPEIPSTRITENALTENAAPGPCHTLVPEAQPSLDVGAVYTSGEIKSLRTYMY